jgi:hypothetical protein
VVEVAMKVDDMKEIIVIAILEIIITIIKGGVEVVSEILDTIIITIPIIKIGIKITTIGIIEM